MSVEQRPQRPPVRGRAPRTYFVGRRLFEAAEVYAVTPTQVERLGSRRRQGERALDWHGTDDSRIELSRLLIGRVAQQRPSRELQRRFALYVLARLPDGGFVLDADEILRWLRLAADEEDFVQAKRVRRSWTTRIRRVFHNTKSAAGHDRA